MKLAVLTSASIPNIYLVNCLAERHNVVAKIIEQRPQPLTAGQKMHVRLRMLKKYGLMKTVNKLLYNKYRNRFIDPPRSETLKDWLFPDGKEVAYTAEAPSLTVQNINDQSSIDFLKHHDPDVIAVCGTTVIKPQVFTLSRKGTINIHCGIIPEYRSADPLFWALYNNDQEKVGVTIHYVDEGIDTGPIIYQEPVPVTRNDTLATLYAKSIRKGAELMSRAIDDFSRDQVRTITKDVAGKSHYHMDLGMWEYLVFQKRFRKLKSRL